MLNGQTYLFLLPFMILLSAFLCKYFFLVFFFFYSVLYTTNTSYKYTHVHVFLYIFKSITTVSSYFCTILFFLSLSSFLLIGFIHQFISLTSFLFSVLLLCTPFSALAGFCVEYSVSFFSSLRRGFSFVFEVFFFCIFMISFIYGRIATVLAVH